MKTFLIIGLLFAGSANAQGVDKGNGGGYVLINSQWCLLDFVPGGAALCAKPYYDSTIVVPQDLLDQIGRFFPEVEPSVARLLGSKILELDRYSHSLGVAMKFALKRYAVKISAMRNRDARFETTPVDYKKEEFCRVAIRSEPEIHLDPTCYPNSRKVQKGALLFHELFSGILNENGDTQSTQKFLRQFFLKPEQRNDLVMQDILIGNKAGAWLVNQRDAYLVQLSSGLLAVRNIWIKARYLEKQVGVYTSDKKEWIWVPSPRSLIPFPMRVNKTIVNYQPIQKKWDFSKVDKAKVLSDLESFCEDIKKYGDAEEALYIYRNEEGPLILQAALEDDFYSFKTGAIDRLQKPEILSGDLVVTSDNCLAQIQEALKLLLDVME